MRGGDGKRLVARTVLDLRSGNDKFICQTLLLAASWHRYAATDADLEVFVIGDDSPPLRDFLDGIGARHSRIPPGPNDAFSKNSNKIEATHADAPGRRVLLLDNDVCILGSLAELEALPADAIAAAEAGTARVSDAQWELIRDGVGLPLLRRHWIPVGNRRQDGGPGDDPALRERWLYVNSGVVLFPAGHDHRPSWGGHQRAIHDFFRGHPEASEAVGASDQAAFASSVAAHGRFAWLPLRFNYRPPCFARGLETLERIGIVHLTGNVDDADGLGLAARMRAYWAQRIMSNIASASGAVSHAERARRVDLASGVLAKAEAVIDEYDLEARLVAIRRAKTREAIPA